MRSQGMTIPTIAAALTVTTRTVDRYLKTTILAIPLQEEPPARDGLAGTGCTGPRGAESGLTAMSTRFPPGYRCWLAGDAAQLRVVRPLLTSTEDIDAVREPRVVLRC